LPTENPFRFAWRWAKDFVLDSRSYIKLFFEFQEIWFMTRKQFKEKTVAEQVTLPTPLASHPLAGLKLRWNVLQQRVAECCWSGRYEEGKQELKAALSCTAEKLRNMSRSLAASLKRSEKLAAADLEQTASDIEVCLTELETAQAEPTVLFRAEEYVREMVLTRYEELSSRCVKLRRKVNRWRDGMLDNLKKGRVVRCGLQMSRGLWLGWVDLFLSLRFTRAAFRKEL
jgi:hypothetical protein